MSHVKIVYDADKGILVPEGTSGEGNLHAKRRSLKVCYIDDSRTSAFVTKKMLKQLGYDVEHFSSAEVALESILEKDYDLLITDLFVASPGGVNGDDLVRLIRNTGHPTKSVMPIAVVTGATEREILDKVIEAGANVVLSKPLEQKSLGEALQTLISNASSAAPLPPLPKKPIDKRAVDETSLVTEKRVPPASPKPESASISASKLIAPEENTKGHLPQQDAGAESKRASSDDIPVLTSSVRVKPEADDLRNKARPWGVTDFDDNLDQLILPGEGLVGEDKPRNAPEKKLKPPVPQSQQKTEKKDANIGATKGTAARETPSAKPSAPTNVAKQDLKKAAARFDEPTAPQAPKQETLEAASKKIGFNTNDISMSSIRGEDEVTLDARDFAVEKRVAEPKPANVATASPAAAVAPAPVSTKENKAQDSTENNPLLALLDHLDQDGVRPQSQPAFAKTTHFNFPGLLSKNFLIVLVTIVFLIPIGFWLLGNGAAEVQLVGVERGDIYDTISVTGSIVSKKRINITSFFPGQIVSIEVREGDEVKKDQVLAKMDDREVKSNVKRAQATLMSIKEDVALTSKTLERLQRALDMGAVSRQMVEDAEAAWKSASAKQSVSEEELKATRLMQERLEIVAPFDGIVTKLNGQAGQWLSPPESLMTLVNLSEREIELKVDAVDSSQLHEGQEVVFKSDAFGGKTWSERISRIATATSREDTANTIIVSVSMGASAPALRLGQQVNAEIRLASRENVLKIPFATIKKVNGQPMVAIVLNSKVHFVPVSTGIEDLSHVEIIKGVSFDQKIVLPMGMVLEEGQKVKVVNPG